MFFLSFKNIFAQEPFVLDTAMIKTIPPKHLLFLEGLDHDISFEALENAKWTEKLINVQSLVNGYWVKFIVKNTGIYNFLIGESLLKSHDIGLQLRKFTEISL